MVQKKLTILFVPLNGWGPVNACTGLAQDLQIRGHRIVMAVDRAFKGKLTPFGFEEELHGSKSRSTKGKVYWINYMKENGKHLARDPIGIEEYYCLPSFKRMYLDDKEREEEYSDIIERVKPDLLILDKIVCSPVLTNCGIPWVWFYSSNPRKAIDDKRLPPARSGLPLNGNKKMWQNFINTWNEIYADFHHKLNENCIANGVQTLPVGRLHPISPYLNIYLTPKELDFEEYHPFSGNWVRIENAVRITKDTFEIPEQLSKHPGKLIFLSMGSYGCSNIELMKRLTDILSKSEHKFIVSKGPIFDSYQLPQNMWGMEYLPQTAVIPLVDLVISHAGNNTVTESFYFGKPLLVLPLLGDQFDNGQRIAETGLGIRLNPFHSSENELLNAVNRLISDKALAKRMTAIGERIRKSSDKKEVTDKIEALFQ